MGLYTPPPLLSSRPPPEARIKSPLKPLRRGDNIRSSRHVHQMTPAFAFSAESQRSRRPFVDKVGNRRRVVDRIRNFRARCARYRAAPAISRSKSQSGVLERGKQGGGRARTRGERLACVQPRERERERERKK